MEITFVLKKIISLFIMPFPLGMLLFTLGLVFLFRDKLIKAKIALSISLLWLFLISYPPLANALLYTQENIYPALHTAPKNIHYIYVLGNGHHTDNTHPITSQVNEVSSVRLNEAIRLYKQLDEKPTIIVSGYSGLYEPIAGAIMQKNLALSLGVKKEHLHIEPTPKDTQEEAIAAKKYIGDKPFILVTSASHMQRALLFFKHEGLTPIPAPTNHLAQVKHPHYFSFFDQNALHKTYIFWYEHIGLLWQKIKGIS
jgi:uncharacterized SAM-binding protein YcdF (DUF218 family)